MYKVARGSQENFNLGLLQFSMQKKEKTYGHKWHNDW